MLWRTKSLFEDLNDLIERFNKYGVVPTNLVRETSHKTQHGGKVSYRTGKVSRLTHKARFRVKFTAEAADTYAQSWLLTPFFRILITYKVQRTIHNYFLIKGILYVYTCNPKFD